MAKEIYVLGDEKGASSVKLVELEAYERYGEQTKNTQITVVGELGYRIVEISEGEKRSLYVALRLEFEGKR
jgi:hypothetical protein